MGVNVVWFKKDLRLTDHRPLVEAAARGNLVLLYVWEPAIIALPDMDLRHLRFAAEGLVELERQIVDRGGQLCIRVGDVPTLLARLHRSHGIDALWSHEETGNDGTYRRDRTVLEWCRLNDVPWHEPPQTGVIRRLRSRDGWAQRWQRRMEQPILPAPERLDCVDLPPGPRPTAEELWQQYGSAPPLTYGEIQRGGSTEAWKLLRSFCYERGQLYRMQMSTPVEGWEACSRLSPYLALGNISMREVWQSVRFRIEELRAQPVSEDRRQWLDSLRSFESRLCWHCHFMQKLEDEPEMEFRSLVSAYDGLRPQDDARLEAWLEGRTGFPMVDAVMRCLQATGWVNFRMRAMVMSFAAYHLWLDWRHVWAPLARRFTDYEPGIHISQCQMQSGATGINTLRIYNPAKQLRDQDPRGLFVRRWVPELTPVPDDYLAEPHMLPPLLQSACRFVPGRDYPLPIVDPEQAPRDARDQLWAVRKTPQARAAANGVLKKHGSRKRRS